MSEPLNAAQLAQVQKLQLEITNRIMRDQSIRTTAMTMALQALQHASGEWTPKHLTDTATAIHGFLTASAVDVGDTVADASAGRPQPAATGQGELDRPGMRR